MSSSKSTTGVLCVNPEHTRKLVQRQNNIRKRGSASKRQTKVAMQWLQKNSKMCFDDIWVIWRRVKNRKADQIDWKPYMYIWKKAYKCTQQALKALWVLFGSRFLNPLTPKSGQHETPSSDVLHYPENRWWEYSNLSSRSCYLELTKNCYY